MFWLGLCLIAVAIAAPIWRIYSSRNWVIIDALIVDHKEVKSEDGAAYQPIVQITDINGRRHQVHLNTASIGRQGGTVVVRYPVGYPSRARTYVSPTENLLICVGIGLAGVLMIATSGNN